MRRTELVVRQKKRNA